MFKISVPQSYLYADGVSCVSLSLRNLSRPGRFQAPELQSNLGRVGEWRRKDEGWEAEFCSDTTPGKVKFRIADGRLFDPPLLYEVPPPAERYPSRPVETTHFELEIDPVLATVQLSSSDILDAYSIELTVFLNPDPSFLFSGHTVIVGLLVEGTNTPLDLMEVRPEIDEISSGSVTLINPDGHDPWFNDAPYYDYGSFPDTAQAVAQEGGPAVWGAPWIFEFRDDESFTVRGTVRVLLPFPKSAAADFRIRPFLGRLTADSVSVSWETDEEADSIVVYGPTPECEWIATGEVERNRIFEGYLGGFPRWFNSFFHRVTLTGLTSGATYYYIVLPVKTPPPAEAFAGPPAPAQPFSFGAFGDTRTGHANHAAVIGQMLQQPFSFVLHLGDLVEAGSKESQWLTFFEIEAPLLKNRPILPAPGNHDQGSFDLFYRRYFAPFLPPSADPSLAGRVYSFDYGNSHFVSLDTDLPVDPASDQYQWLEHDLAEAQADPTRRFTFVVEHHPVYSAFPHGQYPDGWTYLYPLYQAYDVDAVFAGHVHLYERSNVNGRPYLVVGGGGAPFHFDSPDPALNPYYVTSLFDYSFVRVEVSADAFDIYAFTSTGALFDQFHYAKP